MRKLLFGVIMIAVSTLPTLAQESTKSWSQELTESLEFYGHRNWILVVDAAYPMQSKSAIKTIATGEKQLDVVRKVLAAIERASHVYPEVFLDKEIDFVQEKDAAGIDAYREELTKILSDISVHKVLHEELIIKIDEAAKTFNILVLKTDLTIPYTSVFLRLDCGYWNSGQEQRLRELIKN